jgi:DNA-binding XRE family transcriptional regulator
MEAAEKLNVSLKTLQNWEAGTTLPRVDRLPVICSLYKCTIEDLIF